MPQCSECGRELLVAATASNVCDRCRQLDYAEHAEQRATEDTQEHFLVTNVLLAINIAVFVLMALRHVPLISPTTDDTVRWGANFGPLTLGTQPWRLVSAIFVHIGLAHVLSNLWALFILGRLAEALYGRRSFLMTCLLAGLAGNLASLLWNPMAVSAGASGAIFGIAGALIASLYIGHLPFPKRAVRMTLASLLIWSAFVLVYGIYKAGVDNACHIGGLISGLLLGAFLGNHLGPEKSAHRFRERLWAVSVLVLVLFGFGVYRVNGYVVRVERARESLALKKYDDAIRDLQAVSQRKPSDAYVHLLLGEAFYHKSDLPNAEQEFKQIVALNPKNAIAWKNLGQIYLRSNRWPEAADAFARSGELGPDGGLSWFNAAVTYRQLDQHDQAVASFRKAVAQNPSFAEAWFALGLQLLSLKRPAEAVPALQQAARLHPNDPETHQWLANAFSAAGNPDQAQSEYFKAMQLRALQQRQPLRKK